MDREPARVLFDPRRLERAGSDEEGAGEQGRCEDVGRSGLGELGATDVRPRRGRRSALEANPGPDRQTGKDLRIFLLGRGRGPRTPSRCMVPPGLGETCAPASMLFGRVGGLLDRAHDVRDAKGVRSLGGAGEGQEGGRGVGCHGDRGGGFGPEWWGGVGLVVPGRSSGWGEQRRVAAGADRGSDAAAAPTPVVALEVPGTPSAQEDRRSLRSCCEALRYGEGASVFGEDRRSLGASCGRHRGVDGEERGFGLLPERAPNLSPVATRTGPEPALFP